MIYLDNNATTRMDPRVLDAMLPFLREEWGNPSSPHRVGRSVTRAVARARRAVADAVGADPSEIVFTGSGTESDNLAIRGTVEAAAARGERPRVVTTAVEHPAVLETCRDLERRGRCALTVVPVDGDGGVRLDRLDAALRDAETTLVSIMWVNNETGVVFPLEEIAGRVQEAGARLHVDAVQAVGKLPVDLRSLPADLLTFSGHKIHGPKGVGVLVVREGVELAPAVTGGGQERGRRSGTEDPAAIVGLAAAVERAEEVRPRAVARMQALRDRLENGLLERVPDLEVSGRAAVRVANTLHVTVPDTEAEPVLLLLDRAGIACSAGSACSTGALEPSHVLVAMGIEPSRLHGGLRLSLSRETTGEEIDRVLEVLPSILARVARIAPPARGA